MRDFIAGLPKAELHLHIEGTLRPEAVVRLGQRNGVDLPFDSASGVVRALADRPAGLEGFLDHHYLVGDTICTGEDFFEVTHELLETCRLNNIVYVELFFDPQAHTSRGIPFDAVVDGIQRGLEQGRADFAVDANLIMCINRERTVESALEMLDQARPHRDRIIGLGMDSYEEGNPPRKFVDVFARARQEGYRLTAHCDVDQTKSVQHIWECIDLLGVDRIDHGVNCIEDPALVAELVRRDICLTPCPVWRSTDPGPQDIDRIRTMYDLGLRITLNSDDPGEFDSGYLTDLMTGVQDPSGYSKADMTRLAINAFEGSWLDRVAKDRHIAAVLEYATSHGVAPT